MTLDDPPRLKSERGLPAALGVALHASQDDGFLPNAEAVSGLEQALIAALASTAGLTAASSAARGGKLLSLGKLVSSKGGIAVLHFMLGAAVGVSAMQAGPLYRTLTAASTLQLARKPPVTRAPPGASNREAAPLSAAPPALSSTAEPSAFTPTQASEHDAAGPRVASSTQPPPKDAGSSEPAELSEVDLIERAHRALPSDPQRALAWLREDERRFPNGTFAQERDAIAIEALVGKGDMTAARARAAQFRARFPGSAYAAHVASLVRANK